MTKGPTRASRAGQKRWGGEEAEKDGMEPTIDSLAGHVKEFGFYPLITMETHRRTCLIARIPSFSKFCVFV